MQLIVISNPDTVADEAQLINQLFAAGLKRFHLRKPEWNDKQMADLLKQIDHAYYPDIALHQHHHIALDFAIKRLHYTEQHRLATNAETLIHQKEQGFVLSTSIHTLQDLRSFENFVSLTENALPLFDYAFLGPVFNSISKPGYQSKLTSDFRMAHNNRQTKVIALGGVQLSNLDKLKAMGFDGAAVLGTIWNDPEEAIATFTALHEHFLLKQND